MSGLAQFWELGDQGSGEGWPYAGDGAQQRGSGPPVHVVVQQSGDIPVQLVDLGCEQVHVLLYLLGNPVGGLPSAVAFLGLHSDQLSAPRHQISHRATLHQARTVLADAFALKVRQASRRSVLARRPLARANCRTWRGLTTTTGKPAALNSGAFPDGGDDHATGLQLSGRKFVVGVTAAPGSVLRIRPEVQSLFGHVNAHDCSRSDHVLHSQLPLVSQYPDYPALQYGVSPPTTVRVSQGTKDAATLLSNGIQCPRIERSAASCVSKIQGLGQGNFWKIRSYPFV